MSSGEQDLRRLVADLLKRLERVERHLRLPVENSGGATQEPAPIPLVPPTAPVDLNDLVKRRQELHTLLEGAPTERGAVEEVVVPPPLAKIVAPMTNLPLTAALTKHREEIPLVAEPKEPAPPPVIVKSTPEPKHGGIFETLAQAKNALGWERLIGGRLFAVLGGLAVVIAIGMFVKLGVDRGWFTLPPALRCVAGAVVGLVLMGAGEYVRRRLGDAARMAHAGISGAGLAVVYGSAYAAHGVFGILPAASAFPLLALISVFGIGVALYARSLPLAIMALACGYVNPFLMQNTTPTPWVWPSYLCALLLLGLGLAGWKPDPFRALRSVVWWGTVVIGTFFIVFTGAKDVEIILGFLGVVWLMVHAELFIGSRREPEAKAVPLVSSQLPIRLTRPAILSFASTIWCVTTGVLVVQFSASTGIAPWMIPGAGLAGTLVAAMMLAGNLRVLADRPETDAERLGASLWMQGGGLLIATVALGVSDWTQTVSWFGMGLAAIATARVIQGRSMLVYGLLILAIGTVRVIVMDSWMTPPAAAEVLGLRLTAWTALMFIAGCTWGGAAWLIQTPQASDRRRTLVNVCMAIGMTLPFVGLLHTQASLAGMVIAWGLLGVALVGAGTWRKSTLLEVAGGGVLGVVTIGACAVNLAWKTQMPGVSVLASTKVWPFVLGVLCVFAACSAFIVRSKVSVSKSVGFVVLATFAGLMVSVIPGVSLGVASVAAVAIGVCLCLGTWGTVRHSLDVIGVTAIAVSVLFWLIQYLDLTWWPSSGAGPMQHPAIGIALLIVLAVWGMQWLLSAGAKNRQSVPELWMGASCLAGVMLFAASSVEVVRSAAVIAPADVTARAAALSIWWGVFAVGMLAFGFMRARPLVRHMGLGLLMVAATKVAIFDLAVVNRAPEWRILSFLGLGLLMLGVSVVYAKVSARVGRTPEKASTSPEAGEP